MIGNSAYLFAAMLLGAPLADGDFNRAVWADLALNAMIGNGNELAAGEWYFGHDRARSPTLRLSEVRCNRRFGQRDCRFTITRTPHPESSEPEADAREPRQLNCRATLHRPRRNDGRRTWKVLHFPPHERRGGHSVTSLQCRSSRGG